MLLFLSLTRITLTPYPYTFTSTLQATLKDNASAHFVRAILVMLKSADQLAINRAEIKDVKVLTIQASATKEDKRLVHQDCTMKHSGAVSKRLTTEKILTDMMKYARFTMRKAKLYVYIHIHIFM